MKKTAHPELATLAQNIRDLREKMRLSQGQFARSVGVTQQRVSDWERGLSLRSVVVAWRLADVLSEAIEPSAPSMHLNEKSA